MNRRQRLTEILLAGVELWVEGGRLRFRAPAGTLDDAARALLAKRRDEILRQAPEGGRIIPVSSPQQRLWFLHRVAPEDPTYNVPQVLRLRGRLDVPALARSLDEIVRRHGALRALFPAVAGEPLQVLVPPGDFALPVVDVAASAGPAPLALDLAQEEVVRPFDLTREPPLRALLLRLGAQDHLLVLTIHHIAFDAWSVGLLLTELGAGYSAFTERCPTPLPPLPAGYEDFVLWQGRRAAGEELRPAIERWRRRLAGSPSLALPYDRPAPAAATWRGGQVFLDLDRALTRDLEAFARRQGATQFNVLLAALQALLGRSASQEDFNLGTPVTGRARPDFAPLLGFFANNLVVRADLAGNPVFSELVGRVRAAVLDAFADQDVPFDRLVAELHPGREVRTPFFQALFHLHDASGWTPRLAGLTAEPVALDTGTAKLDLALTAFAAAGELRVRWEYTTDRFDRPTIARLAGHLRVLLAAAVADPALRLDALPLLDAAERHQLLTEWMTVADAPSGLPDGLAEWFAEQVARTPDAAAAVCDDAVWSYAHLARQAAELAARLTARGVGTEVRVALFLDRSLDLLTGIVGVLAAGGAYVPLDPGLPPERAAWLLGDVAATVLVTRSDLLDRLPAERPPVVCLDRPDPAMRATLPRFGGPAGAPRDRLAYVIYTSGSTGMPKGCLIAQSNVLRLFPALAGHFPYRSDDVWTLFHSYAFDFAVWEMWGALLFGGTVVVVPHLDSRSPDAFLRLLAERQVTALCQTPGAFRQLTRVVQGQSVETLPALRWIMFAGEALDLPNVGSWLARRGEEAPAHINLYGITETTVHITWRQIAAADIKPGPSPAGWPISDLAVVLLDRWQQPAPLGTAGEICVAGAGLARGYLNRPETTARHFVPHPSPTVPGERLYRTGDLGRLRPDGDLEVLGRIDHQVKIRGFRIEPAEIVVALAAHPAIAASVVEARPDAAGEHRLVAWVVPAPPPAPAAPAAGELRTFLRGRLPEHMVPTHFVRLDALPVTRNGKLDRAALPLPVLPGELRTVHSAPAGTLEARVARLWGELLEAAEVGLDDDFFALGGHSLLAVRLLHRVSADFGVEISLARLLAAPTVAGLAATLAELGVAGERAGDRREAGGGAARRPTDEGEIPGEGTAGEQGETRAPASFAQRRLWLLDQVQGASAVYNVARAVHLDGVAPAVLHAALAEVVRRHEVLRTVFVADADGEPVQVVRPAGGQALPIADLSALPATTREAEARRLAAREAARPFDLARGPLLRTTLLRLGSAGDRLLLTLHHAVADAWSLAVLFRELGILCNAFASGTPSPLPPLPAQYVDFARRQRAQLDEAHLATEITWWRERLAGAPAVLDLPADRPRPAVQSFRGALADFALPVPLAAGLRQLAREGRTSLFVTLLAGFEALLARLTGAEDVVLGTPVAERGRPEWADLIGFFLNTVVLRGDLSGNPSFRALLERTRGSALAVWEHAGLPFELLVEELRPERRPSHAPLFQTLFILDAAAPAQTPPPGLTLRPEAVHSGTAKFDLTLLVEDDGTSLHGCCEYATDRFEAATIDRLLGHWQTLLAGAVATPDRPLAELPLLAAAERRQLLEWGQGAALPAALETTDVVSRVEARAAAAPEAPAVVAAHLEQDGRLTYRQLDRRANRLAHQLRGRGVGPDARVALLLGRGPEMAVAVLAVLKAGGAYVPIDPAYPPARIALMLELARPTLVLATGGLSETAESAGIAADPRTVVLDPAALREEAASGPERRIDPDHLAYVIFTSGSTGTPKGVALPHRALANLIAWQLAADGPPGQPPKPPPVTLQLAALSFDVSFQEMFATWCAGGALVLVPEELRRDPRRLLALLAAERVERLFAPVAALEALAEEAGAQGSDWTAPTKLQQIVTAGEQLRLSPPVKAFLARLPGCELHNQYGPSETHVTTAYALRGAPAAWPTLPPIGRPIANVRAVVLDRALHLVPALVEGELFLGGVALARGYFDRPDATAERFVPDSVAGEPGSRLYRTGDRVRLRPDGELEFLGRVDRQVKLRGHRVEPAEIEAALLAHPIVRTAAVVLRGDGPGTADRRLVAYVVVAGDPIGDQGGETARALRAHLVTLLPEALVPSHIELLPALPLTPSGKVDRRALPAPSQTAAEAPSRPPRTPIELALAAIWCEVLGLPAVGADDDFFALGGHSLLAARVMARVRRNLAVDLPLGELFAAPTVAGLAAAVERGGTAGAAGTAAERPRVTAAPRVAHRVTESKVPV